MDKKDLLLQQKQMAKVANDLSKEASINALARIAQNSEEGTDTFLTKLLGHLEAEQHGLDLNSPTLIKDLFKKKNPELYENIPVILSDGNIGDKSSTRKLMEVHPELGRFSGLPYGSDLGSHVSMGGMPVAIYADPYKNPNPLNLLGTGAHEIQHAQEVLKHGNQLSVPWNDNNTKTSLSFAQGHHTDYPTHYEAQRALDIINGRPERTNIHKSQMKQYLKELADSGITKKIRQYAPIIGPAIGLGMVASGTSEASDEIPILQEAERLGPPEGSLEHKFESGDRLTTEEKDQLDPKQRKFRALD